MNYYLDTEFLEGTQKTLFGQSKPTIDLISVGIISEDNREYYAISKDFNLKEAWNRFNLKLHSGDGRNQGDGTYKEYWIRENVLRTIFDDLVLEYSLLEYKANQLRTTSGYNPSYKFNYKTLKKLINLFGKTNKQIAEEIIKYTKGSLTTSGLTTSGLITQTDNSIITPPTFYAYFADYDWVVFCWLFGKMIDLPKGFPKYCIDLKQIFDEKCIMKKETWGDLAKTFDMTNHLKTLPNYPKQDLSKLHNAIGDARWNKKLHKFITNL